MSNNRFGYKEHVKRGYYSQGFGWVESDVPSTGDIHNLDQRIDDLENPDIVFNKNTILINRIEKLSKCCERDPITGLKLDENCIDEGENCEEEGPCILVDAEAALCWEPDEPENPEDPTEETTKITMDKIDTPDIET